MVAESLFKDRYSHRFATILNHDFPEKHRIAAIAASWALVLVIAALIFTMSAKDGATLDHGSGFISAVKTWLASTGQALFGHPVDVSPVGHFSEYFVFGASLLNALRWHLPAKNALFAAPLIASLYGVTDEIHQILRPHALLRPGRLGGRHRCGDRRCDTCLRRD